MDKQLKHDVATLMAKMCLDFIAARLLPITEQPAWDELHMIAKGVIEEYEARLDRMKWLRPSDN